ncbi:MAG TPA: hypothetical protein VMZ26_14220 [Pyrinomonadaceae bacterium]|nr:hypothetical protein [Pyrinomonadaceae bacterium]
MPNNKDNAQREAGSSNGNSPMGNMSGAESEGQDQNQLSGRSTQDLQSSGGYGKDTGDQGNMDESGPSTAGGREGHFSDKNRGSQGQWSPGASGGPSDE